MNQEIKNEMNVSKLDEKIISNNDERQKGQTEELVHGKTRAEWIRILGTVPDMRVEDMTKEEMMALSGNVPLFLDAGDRTYEVPVFISTTNIVELFDWKSGESLEEAIARKNGENG